MREGQGHMERERKFALYEERKRALLERLARLAGVGVSSVADASGAEAATPAGPAEVEEAPDAEPVSVAAASEPAQAPARVLARKELFSEVPRIEGERIVLDRVVDSDADALRDLIDNPRVQRYLPTYLFELTVPDVREAIQQLYGDLFTHKESIILAIRLRETGELAGLAEFYGLRAPLHKVSTGYRLRERWWGHGLATEAARLMVSYLYDETDIEIVTASTMVENAGSAHVLEKVGFIRTARAVEEDWGYPEPTIVDKWFY